MELKDSKFMSKEQKQKILNQLKKFIDSGFYEARFTKDLYEHLHLHCGFIAHYNKEGFYQARFANHKGFLHTIHELVMAQRNGGSDYKDINTKISEMIAAQVAPLRKTFKKDWKKDFSDDVKSLLNQADLDEANRLFLAAIENVKNAAILKMTNKLDIDVDALQEVIKVLKKESQKGIAT